MRLPSFIKLPRHERFQIEPRYYDPVKEEIEGRTEKIRREIELRKRGESIHRHSISNAFHKKERQDFKSSLGIVFLILVLGGTSFGYLYYPEHAGIILSLGSGGFITYLYLRIKGIL